MASVLLLTAILPLSSCSSSKTTKLIDFGKKYMLNENEYYVFESDKTGYSEYKYKETDDAFDSIHNYTQSPYSYTQSGRVDFVWREASDGAIYLFRVETHYNEDHTEEKSIPLIDEPIYFSEDFFVYQLGSYTYRYIKEGSKLEKTLKDQ